jgi:hypothetical protein
MEGELDPQQTRLPSPRDGQTRRDNVDSQRRDDACQQSSLDPQIDAKAFDRPSRQNVLSSR